MRQVGSFLVKGKKRQRLVPTPEKLIHQGIIEALKILAEPGIIYYHPANEGERSPAEGEQLKRLGLLPGVPDLVFHLPGGKTAFMEIKRPDGGRLSSDQLIFKGAAIALGCRWACVTSITQALAVLAEWKVLKKGVKP